MILMHLLLWLNPFKKNADQLGFNETNEKNIYNNNKSKSNQIHIYTYFLVVMMFAFFSLSLSLPPPK